MFHGTNQTENKQTQAFMQNKQTNKKQANKQKTHKNKTKQKDKTTTKKEGVSGKAAKRNKIKLHAILQCSAHCFSLLPAFAFHTVQITAPYTTFLMKRSWDPKSQQHPTDRVAEVHLHSPGSHLILA